MRITRTYWEIEGLTIILSKVNAVKVNNSMEFSVLVNETWIELSFDDERSAEQNRRFLLKAVELFEGEIYE